MTPTTTRRRLMGCNIRRGFVPGGFWPPLSPSRAEHNEDRWQIRRKKRERELVHEAAEGVLRNAPDMEPVSAGKSAATKEAFQELIQTRVNEGSIYAALSAVAKDAPRIPYITVSSELP